MISKNARRVPIPRVQTLERILKNKEKKVEDVINFIGNDTKLFKDFMVQTFLDKCIAEHHTSGVKWLAAMEVTKGEMREQLFWYKVLACHLQKGIRGKRIPFEIMKFIKLDDNMILLLLDLWCKSDDCDTLIDVLTNFELIFNAILTNDIVMRVSCSQHLSTKSWLRLLSVWKTLTSSPPPETILVQLLYDYDNAEELICCWESCWGPVSLKTINTIILFMKPHSVVWLADQHKEDSLFIKAQRELFVNIDFNKFSEIIMEAPRTLEFRQLLLHFYAATASLESIADELERSTNPEIFFSTQLVELVHIAARDAVFLPCEEDTLRYITAIDNIHTPVLYSVTPMSLNALLSSISTPLCYQVPVTSTYV